MLDKTVDFDDENSWEDFNIVFETMTIGSAEPQLVLIDVPFRNGSLDETDYFGDVRYKDRTITMGFLIPWWLDDQHGIFSEVQNRLNGRRKKIVFSADQDWYYEGRLKVGDFKIDNGFFKFDITATVDPYKYSDVTGNKIYISSLKHELEGVLVSFEYPMANVPLQSLNVDIDPVQDLNGYDHPWSGGSGKNLLKVTNFTVGQTQTRTGITCTYNADGSFTINGTTTANNTFFNLNYANGVLALPKDKSLNIGYAIKSGTNTNSAVKLQAVGDTSDHTTHAYASTNAFGMSSDFLESSSTATATWLRIQVQTSGTTVNNLTILPFFCLSSNKLTQYEPYENICPISGWDSVDVNVVGKNLLPCPYNSATSTNNGITFTANSDGSVTVNGTATGTAVFILKNMNSWKTLPSGTYTLSGCPSGGGNGRYALIAQFYDNGTFKGLYDYGSGATDTYLSEVAMPISSSNFYIAIWQGTTFNNETFRPMLERGSSVTTFEPYNGNTTTVNLGQTVYGGSLNVTSGELTLTHERYAFTGNETITSSAYVGHTRFSCQALTNLADNNNNNNNYCSHFVPATSPVGNNEIDNAIAVYNRGLYWRADQFADVTAMKSYFSTQASGGTPVTYVAKLATPITVQLTPTQVNTLLGQNNVWADSGDVKLVYNDPIVVSNDSMKTVPTITTNVPMTITFEKNTYTVSAGEHVLTGILLNKGDNYLGVNTLTEDANAYIKIDSKQGRL